MTTYLYMTASYAQTAAYQSGAHAYIQSQRDCHHHHGHSHDEEKFDQEDAALQSLKRE